MNVTNGATRTLLSPAPALARDFSLDAGANKLWFTALRAPGATDGQGKGQATTAAEPSTARSREQQAHRGGDRAFDGAHAAPFYRGQGGVRLRARWRVGEGTGTVCVGGARPGGRPRAVQPMGAGRTQLQQIACTAEGPIAFGAREPEGSSRGLRSRFPSSGTCARRAGSLSRCRRRAWCSPVSWRWPHPPHETSGASHKPVLVLVARRRESDGFTRQGREKQ